MGFAVVLMLMSLLMLMMMFFVVLDALSSGVACPGCSTKIGSSRIKSGKPCPTCGFCSAGSRPTDADLNHECPKCNVNLTACQSVQLWDGKVYCQSCVASESELLLGKAIQCQQFQELIRPAFHFPRHVFHGRHVAIAIRDGVLMSQQNTSVVDVALKDCVWFETQNTKIWVNNYGLKSDKNYMVLPGPAIVIRTPSSWYHVHTGQIAVGFTMESYEIWRSLLTIAGLPKMPSETNTYWNFLGDSATKTFYDELAKIEYERA